MKSAEFFATHPIFSLDEATKILALLGGRLALPGGLEELANSAAGFAVLELALLEEVLWRQGIVNLWAATGWYLEQFQKVFPVPDEILTRMERCRPRAPQYLECDRRGGILAGRWNIIMPKQLMVPGEPNNAQPGLSPRLFEPDRLSVGPLEKVVRRGEFVAGRVVTSHPEIEWKLTNVRKQLEKREIRKDIPLPGF